MHLGADVFHIPPDGLGLDVQLIRDFLVDISVRKQFQHFLLSRSEHFRGFGAFFLVAKMLRHFSSDMTRERGAAGVDVPIA